MSGFGATRWSLVVRVAEGHAPGAMAALEQLCRIHWYPIYWFIPSRYRYNQEPRTWFTTTHWSLVLNARDLACHGRGGSRHV